MYGLRSNGSAGVAGEAVLVAVRRRTRGSTRTPGARDGSRPRSSRPGAAARTRNTCSGPEAARDGRPGRHARDSGRWSTTRRAPARVARCRCPGRCSVGARSRRELRHGDMEPERDPPRDGAAAEDDEACERRPRRAPAVRSSGERAGHDHLSPGTATVAPPGAPDRFDRAPSRCPRRRPRRSARPHACAGRAGPQRARTRPRSASRRMSGASAAATSIEPAACASSDASPRDVAGPTGRAVTDERRLHLRGRPVGMALEQERDRAGDVRRRHARPAERRPGALAAAARTR